jgi:hypothetical protein
MGVDWIHLAQNRDKFQAVVNTVMKFRDPQIAVNLLVRTVGFSRRTLLHAVSYTHFTQKIRTVEYKTRALNE